MKSEQNENLLRHLITNAENGGSNTQRGIIDFIAGDPVSKRQRMIAASSKRSSDMQTGIYSG